MPSSPQRRHTSCRTSGLTQGVVAGEPKREPVNRDAGISERAPVRTLLPRRRHEASGPLKTVTACDQQAGYRQNLALGDAGVTKPSPRVD